MIVMTLLILYDICIYQVAGIDSCDDVASRDGDDNDTDLVMKISPVTTMTTMMKTTTTIRVCGLPHLLRENGCHTPCMRRTNKS